MQTRSDCLALPPVDPRQLRNVLGSFATGVAIVTTVGEFGRPIGLTVNSFNSVSLDPPLILWSLSLKAPSLSAFRGHEYFAINILSEGQQSLCKTFSVPAADKFADVAFEAGIGGVPILQGTAAHLECRTHARHPGGDHEIYLGEVVAMHDNTHAPLVFHRGAFHRLAEPSHAVALHRPK